MDRVELERPQTECVNTRRGLTTPTVNWRAEMQPIEWRPIAGFEGYYEVSSDGQVRSVDRYIPHPRNGVMHMMNRLGRTKALRPNDLGYLCVHLYRDGKLTVKKVSHLVAAAFIGPKPTPGLFLCHNNGTKADNRVENLRWDTPSANNLDSVRHGTHGMARKTHCKRGHPFDEIHSVTDPATGHRKCKTCQTMTRRRWKIRKREEALHG